MFMKPEINFRQLKNDEMASVNIFLSYIKNQLKLFN